MLAFGGSGRRIVFLWGPSRTAATGTLIALQGLADGGRVRLW